MIKPFRAGALLLLLLAVSCCFAGSSGSPSRDLAAEAKIEAELLALDPSVVESFRNARIAMDSRLYADSERLLRPILAKVPTFDPAWRRLGTILVRQGKLIEGMALVEKAVSLKRSSENLYTLAWLIAFPPAGSASPEDNLRALGLLREAMALPDGADASAYTLLVQLYLSLRQPDQARIALAAMASRYPDTMQTHHFSAILAAFEEKWALAKQEIQTAGRLGLDDASVKSFLDDSTAQTPANDRRLPAIAGGTLGLWVASLLLLCVLGFALSKTLRRSRPPKVRAN